MSKTKNACHDAQEQQAGEYNPLTLFFQSSSDASNLEASQQEELEKRFQKWWEDYKIVYQRKERSKILLSIEGVAWQDNMLFTLLSLDDPQYSNIIDAKEILDCSEEQFQAYLSEFKTNEIANAIFRSKC